MLYWNNPPTGTYCGLDIIFLVTLYRMPHDKTPYGPPLLWDLFQYLPNITPLAYPLPWPLLLMFLGHKLHACLLSFPDFWGHIQASVVVYFPTEYIFCTQTQCCEYNQWWVVLPFLHQLWVFWQGKLWWCLYQIIFLPSFCWLVISWKHITFPHQYLCPIPYYKLAVHPFDLSHVY